MREQRRVCLADAIRIDEAHMQASAALERERRADERSRAVDSMLAGLRAIKDPDDQFVAVRARQQWLSDNAALNSLFDGGSLQFFTSAVDPTSWTWNPDEVMQWAVARGETRGHQITVKEWRKTLFGQRQHVVGTWTGWKIDEKYYEGSYRQPSSSNPIYALSNGMVVEVRGSEACIWVKPTALEESHLPALATAVGLALPTAQVA